MVFLQLTLLFFTNYFAPAAAPSATTTAVTEAVEPPNLFRSTDYGATWTAFTEGLPEDCSARVLLDYKGGLLMASAYHGVYRLSAGSSTWEHVSKGLEHVYLGSMAVRDDLIVIGSVHGRIYSSSDGGAHWQPYVFDMIGGSIRKLFFHGDWLLAGTDNGIYRSADGGKTWALADDMVQVNDIAEHGGRLYAARRDGILVSDDNGANWAFVYSSGGVNRLFLADGKIYGQEWSGGIIRSQTGKFWERPVFITPGSHVKSLAAAIWGGFQAKINDDLPLQQVVETKMGWFASAQEGC